MEDTQVIESLIESGGENERVDFKREYYSREKRYELLKDICAFANAEGTEDKYLIFGINDSDRDVCGITDEIEDVSNINQLLEQNVEPFIHTSVGTFELKGKRIGYIKIHDNNDRPYVIKNDYVKTIRKGDIYIRKGASTFKALRSDLDFMYNKKCKRYISLFSNDLFITCYNDNSNKSFVGGKIQVKFINESDMSMTFIMGQIIIQNQFCEIYRGLFNMNGISLLNEKPYELSAKSNKVEDFFLNFESSDCVKLNFDEDGNMCYPTKAKVIFWDLEDNEYSCDFKEIFISARGDILHKIKRKFQAFRMFLKKEYLNLRDCIINSNTEKLCNILKKGNSYFELIQPSYCLGNDSFPEYLYTYNLIKCALQKNEKMVNYFKEYGLSDDFIDFCRTR